MGSTDSMFFLDGEHDTMRNDFYLRRIEDMKCIVEIEGGTEAVT